MSNNKIIKKHKHQPNIANKNTKARCKNQHNKRNIKTLTLKEIKKNIYCYLEVLKFA